jgi:hypothetical protein
MRAPLTALAWSVGRSSCRPRRYVVAAVKFMGADVIPGRAGNATHSGRPGGGEEGLGLDPGLDPVAGKKAQAQTQA